MSVFGKLWVRCSICGGELDYFNRYGRDAACCSKVCWSAFKLGEFRAILNKPVTEEAGSRAADANEEVKP